MKISINLGNINMMEIIGIVSSIPDVHSIIIDVHNTLSFFIDEVELPQDEVHEFMAHEYFSDYITEYDDVSISLIGKS